MKFSSKDVDNDVDNDIDSSRHYAQVFHGAWSFKSCNLSHLNNEYLGASHKQPWQGIVWLYFKGAYYSYKVAEMKAGRDQN